MIGRAVAVAVGIAAGLAAAAQLDRAEQRRWEHERAVIEQRRAARRPARSSGDPNCWMCRLNLIGEHPLDCSMR